MLGVSRGMNGTGNTTRKNRSFFGRLYNKTQKYGKKVNSFLGKGPQPAKILAPGLYVPEGTGRDEILSVPPHIAEAIKDTIVKTCIENITAIDNNNSLTTKEKAGAITAYIDMLLDGGDYVRIPTVDENGILTNKSVPGIISFRESNTGRYIQNAKSFTKIALIAAGIIGVTGAIVATAPLSVPVIAMFTYAYATSGVDLTSPSAISVASSDSTNITSAKRGMGFQNVVFQPILEDAWKAEQDLRDKLKIIYNAPSNGSNNTTKNEYKNKVLSYIRTKPDDYGKQEQLEKYINNLISKSNEYDSDRYDILKGIVKSLQTNPPPQQQNLSRYMGGARKHHKPSKKTRKNKKSRRHP